MAIEYVGGKTAGVAGSTATNTDVDLSSGLTGGIGSAVQAGDLVIVTYVVTTTGVVTTTINDPGGTPYTLPTGAQQNGSDNFDACMRVGYKFMPATPDSYVRLGPTQAAADQGAYAIQVWRGVSPTQTFDVTPVAAVGNNSARPNPASIRPVTTGAVIAYAVGGGAADMSVAWTFASAIALQQATQAGTNDARAGMFYRTWTSGALDQAASTTGSATSSDSWTSLAMALRPAGSERSSPPWEARTNSAFQHLLVR